MLRDVAKPLVLTDEENKFMTASDYLNKVYKKIYLENDGNFVLLDFSHDVLCVNRNDIVLILVSKDDDELEIPEIGGNDSSVDEKSIPQEDKNSAVEFDELTTLSSIEPKKEKEITVIEQKDEIIFKDEVETEIQEEEEEEEFIEPPQEPESNVPTSLILISPPTPPGQKVPAIMSLSMQAELLRGASAEDHIFNQSISSPIAPNVLEIKKYDDPISQIAAGPEATNNRVEKKKKK